MSDSRNARYLCASALLAIVAAAAAFLVCVLLLGQVFSPGIAWDTVSLWRESTLGKVLIGVPLVIPVLVFGLTFSFIYRRVTFYSA
jgi:ABC-type transport system involved in cytochrome c biogenesis permease component